MTNHEAGPQVSDPCEDSAPTSRQAHIQNSEQKAWIMTRKIELAIWKENKELEKKIGEPDPNDLKKPFTK